LKAAFTSAQGQGCRCRELGAAAFNLGFEDIAIPDGDLSLVDYKIPFNKSESEL